MDLCSSADLEDDKSRACRDSLKIALQMKIRIELLFGTECSHLNSRAYSRSLVVNNPSNLEDAEELYDSG